MLIGFLTGFLAAMLSWQINIIGIHRGLERGRSAPFLLGLGATLIDLCILVLAFAGTGPLLQQDLFWKIAKWLGIAIILFASVKILFHKTSFTEPLERKKRSPAQSFIMGVLVVAGNPAIYLMWIGIVSFLMIHFETLHIFSFQLLFLAEFFAGSMLWYSVLAFFILGHIRQWGEGKIHLISRISAGLLVIAAVLLMFEKF